MTSNRGNNTIDIDRLTAYSSPLALADGLAWIEAEYNRIEDQIRALQKSAARWKTRRNALVPISRLPPEVLSKVFASYAMAYPQSLFRVLHVCSHWRDVGLEAHAVWANIESCEGLQWVMEKLRRSRNAPLSLCYRGSDSNGDILPLFISELLRVRSFVMVHNSGDGSFENIFSDHPGPMLETLQLSVAGPPLAVATGRCRLPRAPQLQTLHVIGPAMEWESLRFHRLTKLVLVAHHAFARPARSPFMDFLRSSPLLEELILHGYCPTPLGNSQKQDIIAVRLPRLRHLELADSLEDCVYTMECLVFPSAITLRLICNVNRVNFAALEELLPRITSNFNGPLSPGRLELSTTGMDNNIVVYTCPSDSPSEQGSTPKFTLTLLEASYTDDSQARYMDVLEQLLDLLGASELKTLNVFDCKLPGSVWIRLLHKLVMLQSLSFSYDNRNTHVLGSLWQHAAVALDKGTILVPHLQMLALRSVKFFEKYRSRDDPQAFLNLMCLWLRRRKENCGSALPLLKIQNCDVMDRDVLRLLDTIVVDVDWDGILQLTRTEREVTAWRQWKPSTTDEE